MSSTPNVPVQDIVASHPGATSNWSDKNLNVSEPSNEVELKMPGLTFPVNPLGVNGAENSSGPL